MTSGTGFTNSALSEPSIYALLTHTLTFDVSINNTPEH